MSDQSFARLEQAFAQADLEGPPGRLEGARENRGGLAVLLLHLKEDVQMNWKRVAEGLIWDFAYTLRKQQEAEARAATLEAQVRELQGELAEGSDYCETLGLQLMRWSKQPAYAWQLADERRPTCSRVHPRTGHLVSSLKLVAQNGVTLPEPHYMRESDGAWFAQNGSFATPGITHWQDMPADPSAAPEQPQQPAPQGGGRVGCAQCGATEQQIHQPGYRCLQDDSLCNSLLDFHNAQQGETAK